MKDWRGVIIELAIIAAMCMAMWVDKSLAGSIVTALAAWGGMVIQRAKIDALGGVSIYPPPGSQAGPPSLRIPAYAAVPLIKEPPSEGQQGRQ